MNESMDGRLLREREGRSKTLQRRYLDFEKVKLLVLLNASVGCYERSVQF